MSTLREGSPAVQQETFPAGGIGFGVLTEHRRFVISVDSGRTTIVLTAFEARDLGKFLIQHADTIEAWAAQVDQEQSDVTQRELAADLELDRLRERMRRNIASQQTATL
jgi:hypothetical protein